MDPEDEDGKKRAETAQLNEARVVANKFFGDGCTEPLLGEYVVMTRLPALRPRGMWASYHPVPSVRFDIK